MCFAYFVSDPNSSNLDRGIPHSFEIHIWSLSKCARKLVRLARQWESPNYIARRKRTHSKGLAEKVDKSVVKKQMRTCLLVGSLYTLILARFYFNFMTRLRGTKKRTACTWREGRMRKDNPDQRNSTHWIQLRALLFNSIFKNKRTMFLSLMMASEIQFTKPERRLLLVFKCKIR